MITPEYKELDYQAFLLVKIHLKKVKEMSITISGRSMVPLYSKDVQTTRVQYLEDPSTLKRFDIIVFWQNNILVSHYFWKKNEHFNDDPKNPYIITRPLNPIKSFDHPVKYDQILGTLPEKISFWLKLKVLYNKFF